MNVNIFYSTTEYSRRCTEINVENWSYSLRVWYYNCYLFLPIFLPEKKSKVRCMDSVKGKTQAEGESDLLHPELPTGGQLISICATDNR